MKPYTDKAHIAVIGGSGLYSLEGMQMKESIQVDTPYGKPSGGIRIGQLEGKTIAFLARHGEGHRFNPTHVPYRANIYALKSLGVRRILAVS
ncbi:MAG TPA: S-methyl-5'-thioadenosine phosphorylase, partial [bacterium]|nr:S-methyl-5'-thioadenosine phosphorylase [bacterium]